MDNSNKQNILEMKRKFLINIAEELGCTVNDAICFATEEYYLGRPNIRYGYHEYKEHFMLKINGTCKTYPNHGKLMTEMIEYLFDRQISECYVQVKKFVYSYLEHLDSIDEGWEADMFSSEFNVIVGVFADRIMEMDEFNFDAYGWMPKNDSMDYDDAPVYNAVTDIDLVDIDPETLHIEDNEKKKSLNS